MAKLSSIIFGVFIILEFTFFLCDANDDNPKLHIIYMGSLPERAYSPTSHHLEMLQQVFDGSNATNSLVRSFKRSFNGFVAMLTNKQMEKLTQMKDVVSVFPSKTLQIHTTRSWDFLGFPNSVKRNQTAESDFVVGVIDTGIWPESDSFSDQGFDHVPKKWKGTCAGGKNFTCNKKIIGARFYVEESARDNEGHGSHTASIAAGNNVNHAGFYGIAEGTARGGVPSSRVATYKVCKPTSCDNHNILAAFDDAIADGVDIISISLGGSDQYPFENDVIAIGSFHAMAKGILTVNSAGNNGPSPSSVSSVAPWILTVASNTIDRRIIDKIVLGNGKTLIGNSINSFTSNGTKFPISLHNGDSEECPKDRAESCQCLDSNLVKGKIVLCPYQFGVYEAKAHGVVGAITGDGDLQGNVSYVTSLPSLSLHSKDYDLVKSYTSSTKNPQAEILKSEIIQDHTAPRVAAFSSRGPNNIVSEILKPDISAPGVDILAAFSPIASPSDYPLDKRSVKYNILSGTSMSCPHISGIATYLKTFHPSWSPAAIKSAIMTSAQPMSSSIIDDVGEYAYGSGQVNPVQAISPGLVYDINKEDYVQMLCNLGYDNDKIKMITGKYNPCFGAADRSLVRNLNYPALAIQVQPKVLFNVSFSRTVTNVGLAHSSYSATVTPNPKINITVTPKYLSFKSLNEKQSFVVTIVGKIPSEIVLTSSIVWSDGTHKVRSPIIVNVSH